MVPLVHCEAIYCHEKLGVVERSLRQVGLAMATALAVEDSMQYNELGSRSYWYCLYTSYRGARKLLWTHGVTTSLLTITSLSC